MKEVRDLFYSLQEDQRGFVMLSEHLKKTAGISMPLNHKNLCLMASRLGKLFKRHQLSSYQQLLTDLQKGQSSLQEEFVRALTTNTTHFFREPAHFSILERELPRLLELDRNHKELRLWCAAASSGQEPYTLAMVGHDFFSKRPQLQYRILATDIDEEVLAKAARGYYTEAEVEGLPSWRLQSHFDVLSTSSSQFYRIKDHIAKSVTLAKLNLLIPSYPFQQKFHAVFVRNVFIYFERDLIDEIIEKVAAQIYTGGLLFLGHSESGVMRSPHFKPIAHAVFQRL